MLCCWEERNLSDMERCLAKAGVRKYIGKVVGKNVRALAGDSLDFSKDDFVAFLGHQVLVRVLC